MKRSEDRILTTHVGSLIRPKPLLEAGKAADRSHHEQLLTQSVADVVARQAAAGIDIVNDGEFGKSGWANYALERMTGFEPRPDTLYPAVWLGRDRIRFADFMAAEFPRGVTGTPGHACIGPRLPGRRRCAARLANLGRGCAAPFATFFTAVAPASVGYDARNEYYAASATIVRHRPGAARRISRNPPRRMSCRSVTRCRQYGDHFLSEPAALSRMGRAASRRQSRARRHSQDHPLSCLLRQLVCMLPTPLPVHHSFCGQCRRLFDRGRECAHEHEWRVCEGDTAAGRSHPGRGHAPHRDGQHPRLVADRIVIAKLVRRERHRQYRPGFAQGETIARPPAGDGPARGAGRRGSPARSCGVARSRAARSAATPARVGGAPAS